MSIARLIFRADRRFRDLRETTATRPFRTSDCAVSLTRRLEKTKSSMFRSPTLGWRSHPARGCGVRISQLRGSRHEMPSGLHPLHERVILIRNFIAPPAKSASAQNIPGLEPAVDFLQQLVTPKERKGVSVGK
jgi:hypothetical protein